MQGLGTSGSGAHNNNNAYTVQYGPLTATATATAYQAPRLLGALPLPQLDVLLNMTTSDNNVLEFQLGMPAIVQNPPAINMYMNNEIIISTVRQVLPGSGGLTTADQMNITIMSIPLEASATMAQLSFDNGDFSDSANSLSENHQAIHNEYKKIYLALVQANKYYPRETAALLKNFSVGKLAEYHKSSAWQQGMAASMWKRSARNLFKKISREYPAVNDLKLVQSNI